MTDLERVRENPSEWDRLADVVAWAKRQAEADNLYIAVDLERVVLAHLKEDAERDRALAAAQEAALTRPNREREVIAEMDDELAKLREERDEAERRAQVNLEDANRGWAENARLREEYEKAKAVLQEWIDRAAELSGQRDTLLAALREIAFLASEGTPGGVSSADDVNEIRHIATAAIAEVEVKP